MILNHKENGAKLSVRATGRGGMGFPRWVRFCVCVDFLYLGVWRLGLGFFALGLGFFALGLGWGVDECISGKPR